MKTPFTLRPLAFTLIVLVLQITSGYCQRMPQDSWYLKKTVETGMFIGGAACDNDGNIYLSDAKLGLIKKFSPTYQLLQTWGGLGTGDGQFGTVGFQPAVRWQNWSHVGAGGMCFTAAQELVVCDPANHRVQVFSKTGTFLRKFGTQGTGDGQFNSPVAAAVSADGKIYVADRDNHRIQVFSEAGAFLFKFGMQGVFDGQLVKPTGLAFLPDGSVAVADSGNRRIQIFTAAGVYSRKINQPGFTLASTSDGVLVSAYRNILFAVGANDSWRKEVTTAFNKISAWGSNSDDQITIPSDLIDVVAIAAGSTHTVSLLGDGTMRAWGQTGSQTSLTGVVAISAGQSHTVALLGDGTVRAWGSNSAGQITIPNGLSNVVAIAAGSNHTIALLGDGTVRAWGSNVFSQSFPIPHGLNTVVAEVPRVVAIAAGSNHTVTLLGDGTVRAWGSGSAVQSTIPNELSNVVAIAAGSNHTVALLGDGTVRAWGSNSSGQTTIPNGLTGVVAIAAGSNHTVALLGDGTVRAWGSNSSGQTTIPNGLTGVVAIAAGFNQSFALKGSLMATTLSNGDFLTLQEGGTLSQYTRTFRTILPESPNAIPLPIVISTTQRPGTSLVDIDFRVDDANDATVQVAALAFKNGGTSMAEVIPIKTLVEGSATKLGEGVATGQVHRITWDARADVKGDFEQVTVEILAKDARGLFNLDFIQIPSGGGQTPLKISKTPLKDADFYAAWLWLLATGDPELIKGEETLMIASNKYINGLNATFNYTWNPAWQEVFGTTYQYDPPLKTIVDTPAFFGFSPNSRVGGIGWTGLFRPKKSGVYRFNVKPDDFSDFAYIVFGGENKYMGAWSGSFTVNAQQETTIPVMISYSDDGDWSQSFYMEIQPPGESIREVEPGDFVIENSVIVDNATTPQGRDFLLARMGMRQATPAEILRAQEAGTPGVINQWTPPLQVGPGERPLKVNGYGFETGDTGAWVVPLAP